MGSPDGPLAKSRWHSVYNSSPSAASRLDLLCLLSVSSMIIATKGTPAQFRSIEQGCPVWITSIITIETLQNFFVFRSEIAPPPLINLIVEFLVLKEKENPECFSPWDHPRKLPGVWSRGLDSLQSQASSVLSSG